MNPPLEFSPFFNEARPADPLWTIGPWRIVRCRDSGLVYLANPPSESELREFYSPNYFEGDPSRRGYASYAADESVLRANFRAHLRTILAALRADARDPNDLDLLDYGCAYGFFLDEARPHFKSVRGIEINEEIARIGRERFGLTIDCPSPAAPLADAASLDVITMWDAIEHLARPREILLACARALRPGGRLCITTGDIDSPVARLLGRRWRLVNPPQHISYFSAKTLAALLRECGFEVKSVSRPGRRVSLAFARFILDYLLGRSAAPKPPRGIWGKSFYVNLFDVILVEARRS